MGGGATEFSGTERFAVERKIGEGGMGLVYEAIDRRSGARVALKTLRSVSPSALGRLKTEFRMLQEIEHPNLVSLGELVESDGDWFITMELVRGRSLLDYVCGDAPATDVDVALDDTREGMTDHAFDIARLRGAFGQLAGALCALHARGVLHRDIKPTNALVTDDERLVLLDFGLAMDLRSSKPSLDHSVVGTAAYMAPEQAAGRPVTAAADWYAFGVALYQALTGALPFEGSSLQMLLDKQRADVVPPARRAPNVPADLDALCTELLAYDPDERPSGSHVLRAFGARPVVAVTGTSSLASTLIGRDDELVRLGEVYAMARTEPVAVYVRGQSGMGKSALVKAFLDGLRARDDDVLVLPGRCFQNESVPFKAVDGVVDALAQAMLRMRRAQAAELVPRNAALLPQIFPVFGQVEVIARAPRGAREIGDRMELRARALAALRELFQLLVERRRVVVSIDDLHWSDDDSAKLLSQLLSPPDAPPLLLIATARDTGVMPELPCPVEHIELGPLDAVDARKLAKAYLDSVGTASHVSASLVAAEARGHPLHIEELVRHLAEADPSDRAPRLDEAIWERVSRLPDESRRLVELVAVAGAPLPEPVFMMASELPAEDFARHVSMLRISHLLKRGGTSAQATLEAYHDRVRESVFAKLPEDRRVAHHRRLAIGLELTNHTDFERLAVHHLGAGDRDRAIDGFERAAEAAMTALAFGRAARLYRDARALMTPDDERRAHLSETYGDALASAGRGVEAAAAYREALPGARELRELELRRKIAEQLLRSGHLDPGVEAIDELARAGGMKLASSPAQALRQLLWLRAKVALRGYRYKLRDEREVPASVLARIDTARAVADTLGWSEPLPAAVFHNVGLLAALRAGEPRRLALSMAGETVRLALPGVSAHAKTQRALDIVHSLADYAEREDAWLVPGVDGLVAFHEGRFEEALTAFRDTKDVILTTSARGFDLATVRLYELRCLRFLGRIGELCAMVPELLRDAEARNDAYMITTATADFGIFPVLQGDDPDGARDMLERAVAGWSTRTYQIQHALVLYAQCRLDGYSGDPVAGFDRFEAGWRALRRSLLLRIELMLGASWMVRGVFAAAAAARGGRPGAEAIARKSLAVLRRIPGAWAQPYALNVEAGLAFARGDRDEAVAVLRRIDAPLSLALSARYIVGQLVGGDEGRAERERAERDIAAQGFRNPHRFAAIDFPWRPDDA